MASSAANSYRPLNQDQKIAGIQGQLQENIAIMDEALTQAQKRGEILKDLDSKAKVLDEDTAMFRKNANEARKKMWWKDVRMTIALVITILVVTGGFRGASTVNVTTAAPSPASGTTTNGSGISQRALAAITTLATFLALGFRG
ncbi:synaptobrevin-domain-containing protein [Chytridium lagenaria]|nr:synaptobrevin-domain-containing protein [Chytridium lagenaria]